MMVNHQYLRSPVPIAKLGVEPAVVLPPHLAFVQVRLGRVEGHDLRLALGYGNRDSTLPHPEEILEVPVADVPGVVVSYGHDHVLALDAVEILLRLLELPSVTLHRQVPNNGDEVGL